jgi:ABC-type multidrug transport system fused ATPase/permease subunit
LSAAAFPRPPSASSATTPRACARPSTPPNARRRFANITIQFGPFAKPLFENVSVKFGEGNRYGLIGANGAGKSTLHEDPGRRAGAFRRQRLEG